MHLKISHVKSGDNVYRYARLVESFRREDGQPTQRIVANLGRMSDHEIQCFKVALEAAREGKTVVVDAQASKQVAALRVAESLAYLELGAIRELWSAWGLMGLIARLLPRTQDEVEPEKIVFALVAQRCSAPGSKFYAQRWFPTTALPEMLNVPPPQFNNSRIHRVMSALAEATPELQENLAMLRQGRCGKPTAWFIDVTDTYFEGRGCEMAERSRTKEGLRGRRKVGIVLLCDARGIPVRWEVVPGKRTDNHCMGDMVEAIQNCLWVADSPIVLDRAMGQASSVDRLMRSGLRFLTAVPRNEIPTHEKDADLDIPVRAFTDWQPTCEVAPGDDSVTDTKSAQDAFERDLADVRAVVERAGLERVADDLYVTDLGVGTRPLSDGEQAWVSPDDIDPETLVGGAAMIAWARIFKRVLDSGEVKSRADIARIKGVSRANVTETMNLLKLAATIQEDLLAGKFGGVSGHGLRNIVKLKGEAAQRAALEEYVRTTAAEGTAHLMRPRKHGVTQTLPIRRVAYFNPEMLVTQRLHDRDRRRRIDVFVEQLNEQLRRPGSRKSEADVRFAVMERLSKEKSLRLYNIDIATDADPVADRECLQVTLTLREDQWRRRRCYDGFVLLVAHAGLPHSAEELAKLYRDKDTIERDFRVIKDVVGLRPVYHHTDDKVRAHVTICMLALLIQRAIEIRLAAAGRQMTADRCLEELATCRLNRFEANELLDFDYSVTKPTEEQLGLLKALGASDLVKHQKVAAQLKPR